MRLGSIDVNMADSSDYGLSIEAVKSLRVPIDAAKTRVVFKETKDSFDKTVKSQRLDNKSLEKLLEKFNELAEAFNIQLRFSIRKDIPTHISVKVVNVKTNEVIREIPIQKFSQVGSQLLDAVGLMIDEMV